MEKLRYSNHRNRQTSWNNWMENNKPKFQIWILWNFTSKAWFRKEVWARDTQVLCDYLQTVAHLNPSCLCNASSTVVINNGVITQRIETSALTLHNGDNSHRVLPLQINQSKYLLYSPRCDCRQYSPLLHGERGCNICQYCTSTSLLCNDDNDINDIRQVWCWEMRCLN